MKRYLKHLRRLPRHLRERLAEVIEKIEILDIDDLDIQKMTGFVRHYRCRVGGIRIVFIVSDGRGIILDVNFRGSIY